jgi:hypothetical protein
MVTKFEQVGQSEMRAKVPAFRPCELASEFARHLVLEVTHMRIIKTAVVVLTLSFFGAMVAPSVRAQDDNAYTKKSRVTFNQQVEIPGQFLPAGTYIVQLVDAPSYRHIVRFFNADQSKVVATVIAIPNLRLETTGKTVIMFDERPINSPEALKAWFYPGDNFGQEFVYPKLRAVTLAQETKEPVLAFASAPEPMTIKEMLTLPLVAETPAREEVQVTEVVEIPPAPVLVAQAQTLPKTASPIPLIAMIGAAAIGLAFAAKRFATQRS